MYLIVNNYLIINKGHNSLFVNGNRQTVVKTML